MSNDLIPFIFPAIVLSVVIFLKKRAEKKYNEYMKKTSNIHEDLKNEKE